MPNIYNQRKTKYIISSRLINNIEGFSIQLTRAFCINQDFTQTARNFSKFFLNLLTYIELLRQLDISPLYLNLIRITKQLHIHKLHLNDSKFPLDVSIFFFTIQSFAALLPKFLNFFFNKLTSLFLPISITYFHQLFIQVYIVSVSLQYLLMYDAQLFCRCFLN